MGETQDIMEKIRKILEGDENLEPSSSFFICKQLADEYMLEWESLEEGFGEEEDDFQDEGGEDSSGDVEGDEPGGDKQEGKRLGTKADTGGSPAAD